MNSTILCSEYNSSSKNLLNLETWPSWDTGTICASCQTSFSSVPQAAEETHCGNKCIDEKLRAAHVAGWCCLSAGVGFLVLCRAATPGSPVSSWPWQSLCCQGGWNRAAWRFRGQRAQRRHRLERVKEPISSRDRRKLRALSKLLPAKFSLEILLILNSN